jgi:hypothetical protein
VDDRELDALQAGDPVHDLVHGPVAPDRDEQSRAAFRRLACELDEMPGLLREQSVADQPTFGRQPGNLRPALAGRPVVGRGIDEEDGLANGSLR